MLSKALTEKEARDAVIIAFDCDHDEALRLADLLAGRARWVKVGMTLYYAIGPQVVAEMHERGLKVFLDLKLHDIPFQVRGAAHAASLVGADILSVHGLGGAEMIAQARVGVEDAATTRAERTRIVAISVLTSMDQKALDEIGVASTVSSEVSRLAKLAFGAGSDGIVCSPQEVKEMRDLLGSDALIITPGIRPRGAQLGDQRRVATPACALEAGATKLVIGRPITRAADPAAAFDDIVGELLSAVPNVVP